MHGRRLQLVRLSAAEAVVSYEDQRVSITTAAHMPFVEQVVEALNRGDSPDRLVAGLPMSHHRAFNTLFEALQTAGVPSGDDRNGHRQATPASTTTVLFGVNAISAAAVRSLLARGHSGLVVVHDRVLDAVEEPSTWSDVARGNGRRSDVTVLSEDGHVQLGADHVVLATCDYGLADRLHDLARTARSAGSVMIPAWIDGFACHVGPIARADEPGCLRCYTLRRAANSDRPELSNALRRHATEDSGGRGATGHLEPMTGLLGELCADAISRVHADSSPGGARRTTEFDLVRLQGTARTVLAVPGCPDCGAPLRTPVEDLAALGSQPKQTGSLLDSWTELVDPEVGIVKKVTPLPIDEDEPDFVHYLSTACSTDQLGQLANFANNGGVGVDHQTAVAKAVGEGVERYSSAFFRYKDLTISSYAELPGPATHPDAYALYRPEQYARGDIPWRPFTEDAPVCWTTGVSLCTGERVFLPAAMVYVPFHYLRDDKDTPIAQPISTGLAAGSSFADAALSGLCEAIERDAFTITWQSRLSRPRVPLESLPSSSQDRVARFARAGLRVEIMDITTDLGVPTILTIALGDRPTSPAVAVAASTHPVPEVAVNKSLEELAHTRKFARQVLDYTPALPVDVPGGHPEVTDQKHHLRFYCPQPAKAFAAFAWASEELRPFDGMADARPKPGESQLATVVSAVRSAGLDVIACDLTTSDVAQLGLSVVRIVVPGLHPLFMGHRNRALGGHRLYEVPRRLGLAGMSPGDSDNPYPHPFP